jgi:methylenetetrahydrofolate dehydrogenase (NADP+)/methenyltetrahydrofolate cyclohydrolase
MVLKDIKPYVKELKEQYKERIAKLGEAPKLAIVQVGNNEASNRYVKNKVKDCEEVGIIADVIRYPENTTEFELDDQLDHMHEYYDGIIVQLPLPQHIRPHIATAAIPADKDVDGFRVDSWFYPATPKGIMDYLKYCEFDLTGKDVVIIGRSDIVGKPLARMMTDADATVTLCHSKSKLSKHVYGCDLLVSAVGKAGFVNCYPLHMPIIDVGINFNEQGKLVGDCMNTEGRDVTPVPGGVGLLTRCALLDNVITSKEKHTWTSGQ